MAETLDAAMGRLVIFLTRIIRKHQGGTHMRNRKIVTTASALLIGGLSVGGAATSSADTGGKANTPSYTISSGSGQGKTISFTHAKVTGTNGAPKITTDDGQSGFLPKYVKFGGKKVAVNYSIKGNSVTVTPQAADGKATPYGYWSCVGKGTAAGTAGGAVTGGITGLFGGPFAEVTVPVGAAAGAVSTGAGSAVASAINCS